MSGPRFTAGPWRWWTSNSVRRLSSDATGKDGDVLEAQHSSGLASVRVSDVDASLIASAPDLFKSLSEVLAAYESDMRERGFDDFEQYGEIMRARAALAKAVQS